jgi:hypothetical protein
MIEIITSSYELVYNKTHLRAVLKAAGNEVVKTARGLIQAKGTVSAPGQPPASRTGLLAKSMKARVTGTSIILVDTTKYAQSIEGGAVGGGGLLRGGKSSASIGRVHKKGGAKGKAQTVRMMQPRPFLSTAVASDWPDIATRIQKSVELDIDFIKKT